MKKERESAMPPLVALIFYTIQCTSLIKDTTSHMKVVYFFFINKKKLNVISNQIDVTWHGFNGNV